MRQPATITGFSSKLIWSRSIRKGCNNMLQRICLVLVVQPIHWLFFFFFQPQRFRQHFENFPRYLRILFMLRLALPIVVCNFLLAFVCRSLLADWFPVLYNSCSGNGLPSHTDLCFLIDTARGT